MTNKTYELTSGDYYIGDISYFLQDAIIKKLQNRKNNTYFEDNGYEIVIVKPTGGNGLYEGSDGFIYDIEDENLGIIHVALGDHSKFTGCGTFHTFVNPVTVTILNEVFTVKSGSWNLNINIKDCYAIPSDDEGYDSWS